MILDLLRWPSLRCWGLHSWLGPCLRLRRRESTRLALCGMNESSCELSRVIHLEFSEGELPQGLHWNDSV